MDRTDKHEPIRAESKRLIDELPPMREATDMALPSLANDRTETELPVPTSERIDTEPTICEEPFSEKEDPSLPRFRIETADPIITLSLAEIDPPVRACCTTLKLLPSRVNEATDAELAKLPGKVADTHPPMFKSLEHEKDDPVWRLTPTEQLSPTMTLVATVTEDPIRTSFDVEKTDPTVAKDRQDKVLPRKTESSCETVEARIAEFAIEPDPAAQTSECTDRSFQRTVGALTDMPDRSWVAPYTEMPRPG